MEGDTEPLNMIDAIVDTNHKNAGYTTSFQWIRDLQAVGGNGSRKYVRDMILRFINSYRKTRKFWLGHESWNSDVVGERIVNYTMLYPFFASGANDNFQKMVLSSLAEQFSHLQKCYKAEIDPYTRIIALKALLYCYSSMKTDQHRKIAQTIREIREVVEGCIDNMGMFTGGSPVDHFHVFRSLLEIRFAVKDSVADILGGDFMDTISRMAYIVRFFRMCDGGISHHHGNTVLRRKTFIPDRHMVDTALSVVEIGNHTGAPVGFDKLETKRSTVVINTKPRMSRSPFNHPSEPGINVFDFEASFGDNRILNRADVSILRGGLRTKIDDSARSFTKRTTKRDCLIFEGETQFPNRFFNFAMRREIELVLSGQRLSCIDFALSSVEMDAYFRFALGMGVNIREINRKNILLSVGQSEYMFTCAHDAICMITYESKTAYPTVEIAVPIDAGKALELHWSIEDLG
jgi:hypothetical protein